MDCIATDAFGQIAAIAKLALAAMENPKARTGPEDYAKAFTVIWNKADEGNDSVGGLAAG